MAKRLFGTRLAYDIVNHGDGASEIKMAVQVERLDRDDDGKIADRVPVDLQNAPTVEFAADNTVAMSIPSGSLLDVATGAVNASRVGNTFARKAAAIAAIETQLGEKLNISERDKALLTLGFGGNRFVRRSL
jgi:hypothetical protein